MIIFKSHVDAEAEDIALIISEEELNDYKGSSRFFIYNKYCCRANQQL